MHIKNLFMLILLMLSAGRVAIAQDKKPDFTPVKAGEIAPFDGYLFTPEAIVKVYTKTEEDIKRVKLEGEHKLELAQIDIQKLIDLSESERRIQAKLLQDTIASKDLVIQNKLDTIDKLENGKTLSSLAVVGSFLAGSLITFTIVYFTVDALR